MANHRLNELSLSLDDLHRVNVVGTSGVGKSTFSSKLAHILDSQHVEMDRLHWEKEWQEATDAVFRDRLKSSLATDKWVLDGNYMSRSEDIKWRLCKTVVWIDFSLPRTVVQAGKRALYRAFSKKEIWPGTGNRESLIRTFMSTDSILLWTLATFHSNRKRYQGKMSDPAFGHLNFVRLANRREAKRFLDAVKSLTP